MPKNSASWLRKIRVEARKIKSFERKTNTSGRALGIQFGFNLSHDLGGRQMKYFLPVQIALKNNFRSLSGKRILNIASSTGVFTRYLQEQKAEAIGLDLDREGLGIASIIGNKRQVQADALKLPFANDSMDCVISDHFLFSDYPKFDCGPDKDIQSLKAWAELRRVLKPGGLGIIYRFRQDDFKRSEELIKTGFEVVPSGFEGEKNRRIPLVVLRKKS